jgi:hypothetical protein
MAKKLPKKVQEILAEAKGQLSALYAHRPKEVIPIDYKTYRFRKTPLILNVRKEGVRI